MERIERTIARLAEPTMGLVTRRMLLDAELTSAAIDHRVAVGRLIGVYRGVYSVGHRPTTRDAQNLAAVLACGAGAALHEGFAAAHWRMLSDPPGPPQVVCSGANREGPAGVRLRHTGRLETTVHRGVPVTTPARTLLDLAATGPIGRLEEALNEAQVLKLVSRADLHRVATSGRRGGRAIGALLQGSRGYTRGAAEQRLRALIRKAQFPRPRFNARVEGHDADVVWPQHRLIVEVDGYAAHGTLRAFERDRRLDQERAAAGYRTIRVTWRQLTQETEAVVARIAGALARS